MSFLYLIFRFIFIVGFILAPLIGYAHSGATGVVKQRMDIMKQYKKEMRVISKMVKGDMPYNPQTVLQTAKYIDESASHLPALFPAGSNPHPSEADNVIWQQWDQFLDAVKLMSQQARLLQQDAASGTSDEVVNAYRALTNSCKQCHDHYRQDF